MRLNEAGRLDQRENQGERSQEMEGSDCLQKECIATYETPSVNTVETNQPLSEQKGESL